MPWRRKWHPTPVFLPGKFHGWRNLAGHSLWSCKESDTTECAHTQGPVTELGAASHGSSLLTFYLKAFSKVRVWEVIPLPISGKDLGCCLMKICAQVGWFVCVMCSCVYVTHVLFWNDLCTLFTIPKLGIFEG